LFDHKAGLSARPPDEEASKIILFLSKNEIIAGRDHVN
jgi:hypothetical protein